MNGLVGLGPGRWIFAGGGHQSCFDIECGAMWLRWSLGLCSPCCSSECESDLSGLALLRNYRLRTTASYLFRTDELPVRWIFRELPEPARGGITTMCKELVRAGEGRLTRPPLRLSYPNEKSLCVLASGSSVNRTRHVGVIMKSQQDQSLLVLGMVPRRWCRTSCPTWCWYGPVYCWLFRQRGRCSSVCCFKLVTRGY